jgi:hypothetical protein
VPSRLLSSFEGDTTLPGAAREQGSGEDSAAKAKTPSAVIKQHCAATFAAIEMVLPEDIDLFSH